ncbi:efflux RND transporter periplasmic adaptor subunit [Spiribacter vilamensis]|uniref:HlyD family secretion protein n=1 Tax=Spiribacter vilamensis TaxID=531306 RepID=A0A4Q8CYY2_9GAMM|nr:biotin/lipoyl-binding protein [Spiribacter vilamensis]RZU98174.1 HlyD family secretion protein [Spiribacter vilamensis]TVO60926.1 biotin/lipoyl-binding protein [Spiribacter vilamensis]
MSSDAPARHRLRSIFFRLLLPVIILGLAAGGYVWLKQSGPTPPQADVAEREWLVDTTTIQPATYHPRLTLTGEVDNPDRVSVKAPIQAQVKALPVADGQAVASGELLFALDPADYEPLLQQAEANLADLEAQITQARRAHESDQAALEIEQALVNNAQRSLERTLDLRERDLASPSEVEAARDAVNQARLAVTARDERVATFESRLESLRARRDAARADVSSARRDVRRSQYEAPSAGLVADRQVAVGSRVNASETLLTFLPRDGFEVRALIPSQYADVIHDALVRGEAPRAEAPLLGGGARLQLVRLTGEASGRGVTGVFTFESPGDQLRPGIVTSLSLIMPAIEDAIALPRSALYGNDRVYRVRDGQLERVGVEHLGTTQINGMQRVLIRSDELAAGDRVATTQLPNAVSGLRVQVDDSAGAEQ